MPIKMPASIPAIRITALTHIIKDPIIHISFGLRGGLKAGWGRRRVHALYLPL
jgi:hypothetical protein